MTSSKEISGFVRLNMKLMTYLRSFYFDYLQKSHLPPHTMTFSTLMRCIEPHVSNLIRSITKDKYMGKNKYITLKSLNSFLCNIHMLKIYTLPHSYDKWSESGGEL